MQVLNRICQFRVGNRQSVSIRVHQVLRHSRHILANNRQHYLPLLHI